MRADDRFLKQPKHFWAYVRAISEFVGYTNRMTHQIKVPDLSEIAGALGRMGLNPASVADDLGQVTELGRALIEYFGHRGEVLNAFVQPHLMSLEQARELFHKLVTRYRPLAPIPMNKQKGEKKVPAYFTGIVNILIEANAEGFPCDYDPRGLVIVTREGLPMRALARRVDGAFPTRVNPVAVWEIKEYYFTTTFGSRVADGVYESLLDGMELEELREHEGIDVKHYLLIDDFNTWWNDGRSYLCRIIDMLHMGYVDEVLFGNEVTERLPLIVKDWVRLTRERDLA